MASGNGPDLVCAHCFSMVNNFALSSLTVQFASTVFIAGVGVNVSVAVLYCAVVVCAVDSLLGCGMAVVCLANRSLSCLQALFTAFFKIFAIVEICRKQE